MKGMYKYLEAVSFNYVAGESWYIMKSGDFPIFFHS